MVGFCLTAVLARFAEWGREQSAEWARVRFQAPAPVQQVAGWGRGQVRGPAQESVLGSGRAWVASDRELGGRGRGRVQEYKSWLFYRKLDPF